VQYKPISCPKCRSHSIKKNGTTAQGKQRYRCKWCFRQFITDYSYQGCRPEVRNMILPMTMNGSGIRDISRVLKISINTVLKTIRKQVEAVSEPVVPDRVTELQIDEMWSFVGKKANQRWLWYGFDPDSKKIINFQLGRRTDDNCQKLLKKIEDCQVLRYCTDEWESYQKYLPSTRHWIGKDQTQDIERQNLNFRTHLKRLQRKTICFSKSEEMHDAVLKLYIYHSNVGHHF
jgi:insertion element IS1 protein InsB